MRHIKSVILVLILLVPVFIYLFLRGFGDNQFEVPVYFMEGLDPDSVKCETGEIPHRVFLPFKEDSLPEDLPAEYIFDDKLTVIEVGQRQDPDPGGTGDPLQRIHDLAETCPPVSLLSIRPVEDPEQNTSKIVIQIAESWKLIRAPENVLESFAVCELILLDYAAEGENWQKRLVLVDESGRIRGYYLADDYEEMDRLILEMKILLEEEYS